ncbi:MAG: V-type ATP synthase subunit E [Catonella sp.]|nr:V-type ATP synthase subunit E [Catonella sp.]MDY6356238.1 V-type ATP synthase subunit E [Catonella sp.]
MTGLEKIVGEIKEESNATINEIMRKAKDEAAKIQSEAVHEADEACARIERESAVRVAAEKSRAESTAELRKRQNILAEKQRIIADIENEAKAAILELPDSEYFDTIIRVVKKNALALDGTIIFNAKDLGRLPATFTGNLSEAAKACGGTLTISKETRPIDGGFILAYDGIEQNCSVSSLFEANREVLQDTIQKMLFE